MLYPDAADTGPGTPAAIRQLTVLDEDDGAGRMPGRGARGFFFGAAISPSRWASFRAALRERRTASDFSRARRSDGFS